MNNQITLEKRESGKQSLAHARTTGLVPGVLYGPDRQAVAVATKATAFEKLFASVGSSTLIDCTLVGDASVKVLIQDVQYDPVSGSILHVDFRQVNMSEKMRVSVSLEFVGDAAAVRELGGTMVHTLNEVEIECLPTALVAHLTVDVSSLATFDNKVSVKDLVVPQGIVILNNPDDVIAFVEAPRSEEELAALNQTIEADVSKIEVLTEKKKEEEAPAAEGAKKE